MAVNKNTGNLVWVTQVESFFAAIVTQSAVVDNNGTTNLAYVGVASAEELYAAFIPNYQCCSFRGSMLAVNASTGQILWKTYTVPTGFSGGSVWGSTAVVDHKRGSLYIGTGNNYSVSAQANQCIADGNPVQSCIPADDYFDSILSIDYLT